MRLLSDFIDYQGKHYSLEEINLKGKTWNQRFYFTILDHGLWVGLYYRKKYAKEFAQECANSYRRFRRTLKKCNMPRSRQSRLKLHLFLNRYGGIVRIAATLWDRLLGRKTFNFPDGDAYLMWLLKKEYYFSFLPHGFFIAVGLFFLIQVLLNHPGVEDFTSSLGVDTIWKTLKTQLRCF